MPCIYAHLNHSPRGHEGIFRALTVPSSIYTAVPHAATMAPRSHITSDKPTLPDDRKITLGVAKILGTTFSLEHTVTGGGGQGVPSAYDAVEYQERRAHEACESSKYSVRRPEAVCWGGIRTHLASLVADIVRPCFIAFCTAVIRTTQMPQRQTSSPPASTVPDCEPNSGCCSSASTSTVRGVTSSSADFGTLIC